MPGLILLTGGTDGDVLDRESLVKALAVGDTANYFVHSMGADRDFEQQDRVAAADFGQAAAAAGVRRGRRDLENLHVGDPLDFWRVEVYDPPQRLRLHAGMKLSGRVWLEFEVTSWEQGSSIRQTAISDRLGLAGLLYWYGIYPLHQFVFDGMLRNLGRAAERSDRNSVPPRDVVTEATASETQVSGASP